MRPDYANDKALIDFIDSAIREDIGSGDHSSLSVFQKDNEPVSAQLLIKEDCVLAGVELAKFIFNYYDSNSKLEVFIEDGTKVKKGEIAFKLSAHPVSILSVERLVLNCMQRMSGIATLTNIYAEMVTHTNVKLLDTRKTTPNFRIPEKWAVLIGGGTNHRFALYDMVMLKDNHIDYAGGIKNAVNQCRAYLASKNLDLKIEVETRNINELKQALAMDVDRIMLDNYSIKELKQAVDFVAGKTPLEASGGINAETLVSVAETGVDYISMGALTHSAKNIDLSLKAV